MQCFVLFYARASLVLCYNVCYKCSPLRVSMLSKSTQVSLLDLGLWKPMSTKWFVTMRCVSYWCMNYWAVTYPSMQPWIKRPNVDNLCTMLEQVTAIGGDQVIEVTIGAGSTVLTLMRFLPMNILRLHYTKISRLFWYFIILWWARLNDSEAGLHAHGNKESVWSARNQTKEIGLRAQGALESDTKRMKSDSKHTESNWNCN